VPRLIWTPPALQDLTRLRAFLSPKNADAAKRAIHIIRHGVRTLGENPEIGRPIEGMPPQFRDWFIRFGQRGYVVRYRFDGSVIAILSVRHGKEAGF
jgi:plasmid stabilization system protein ParE